jgi:hypothetical protein
MRLPSRRERRKRIEQTAEDSLGEDEFNCRLNALSYKLAKLH